MPHPLIGSTASTSVPGRPLVRCNNAMELQRSPAPNDGPVVSTATAVDRIIETSIPSRLDALPWSGFHTRVVLALGITWILDGLEVTLAGALSGALKQSPTMRFSNLDLGVANSAYLAGAVLGALGFGWLTDRIGRKKLFFITLALYLSRQRPRRLCHGMSRAMRCFASSPARASAANTPRSIRRSRNWYRRAIAAGPISSSMAASGSVLPWARWRPSCCSIPL
ncbi:hypothetical protein ACVWW2_000597 [Bradyrhizobium sp. LM4.3]